MITTRYYLTLEELISIVQNNPDTHEIDTRYQLAQAFNIQEETENLPVVTALEDFIQVVMSVASIDDVLKSEEANILWCEYIVPKHLEDVVAIQDNDEWVDDDIEHFSSKVKLFATRLCQKFRDTYDKNKKILDYYNENSANLLENAKTTFKNKLKNLPKNGTNIDDEKQLSAFTSSETENGERTLFKIEDFKRLYDNTYREWAKEFNSLFIVVEGECL